MRLGAQALLSIAGLAFAAGVSAQSVTGSFTAVWNAQGTVAASGTFSCNGSAPCAGTYVVTTYPQGCSNGVTVSGPYTLAGVPFTQPGPFDGQMVLVGGFSDERQNSDGTCSVQGRENITFDFTGHWNGTQGTFSGQLAAPDGAVTVSGTFSGTAAPIFGLTVDARIDPQSSTATGVLKPRAEDEGTTQSIYVFAVAPQDRVRPAALSDPMPPLGKAKGTGPKADAVACVLAQLDAQGQLVAVSASSLQAFVTGALSGAGTAVTIINGVPTVNIAGATFYVGYGTSAQGMLNGGVNRNAVAIPGQRECRPQPPQTGWWWQPPAAPGQRAPRDGTGYSIEAQGNLVFFAAFLYDESGRASWYVASGRTSIDGSLFTTDLLQARGGQTLGGAYRPFASVVNAGPITLAFDSATTGTMSWPGGTFPIGRFDIVPNGRAAAPRPNQPESGWWWNPQESGRGFFIEWQDGWADLAGYMYDDAGNPVWYITVVQTPDPRSLGGSWLSFGSGMTLTGAWRPHQLVNGNVAPVSLTFTSATTAVMTLPGGRTTNLQRHRF